MIHRAQDLDLISLAQAERLWINCSRRGWRTSEPLDDQLPVEEPRLLRRSFELLVSEQVQSRAEILSALPYSASEIEELAGLREGFLAERALPVSLKGFKPKAKEKKEELPPRRRDDVVVAFRPRTENDYADLDKKRM
jgi:hypothetical protein